VTPNDDRETVTREESPVILQIHRDTVKARTLLRYLSSSDAAVVYKASGMQPSR